MLKSFIRDIKNDCGNISIELSQLGPYNYGDITSAPKRKKYGYLERIDIIEDPK